MAKAKEKETVVSGKKRNRRGHTKRGSRSMRSLKDNRHLLYLMGKADNNAEMCATLKSLNKNGRDLIYQCIYNSIYNPDISELKRKEIRRKLASEEQLIKYLSNRGRSEEKKKKLLEQRGGFILPLLLSAAIPLVKKIFGDAD